RWCGSGGRRGSSPASRTASPAGEATTFGGLRVGGWRGAQRVGAPPRPHAALPPDLGERGVATRALDSTDALTPDEFTEIKRHPLQTYEILSKIPPFAGFARLASLHHERLNGTGYPWGLSGKEIGAEARMLAVAEVYDALTL